MVFMRFGVYRCPYHPTSANAFPSMARAAAELSALRLPCHQRYCPVHSGSALREVLVWRRARGEARNIWQDSRRRGGGEGQGHSGRGGSEERYAKVIAHNPLPRYSIILYIPCCTSYHDARRSTRSHQPPCPSCHPLAQAPAARTSPRPAEEVNIAPLRCRATSLPAHSQ